ncbi:unnamed protein product [Alopecurus aequalis]
MAAGPGEDLTPLLDPPSKRGKKDPSSYLDALRATATAGWSSLPDDLIRRIAYSFLVTNDVDCYICFRAICLGWRAATDDPRNNAYDPRFNPRRWIVLEEAQGKLLLLNTRTGRFLHKKLPLLHECYVVATTPSGFVVLADTSPPHAARLFNPLTGFMTCFAAPVPPEARVADICRDKNGSLAIILLGDSSHKIYTALPDSECFEAKEYQEGAYNIFRNVVVGGACTHIRGPANVAMVAGLLGFLRCLNADPSKVFSCDYPGDANDIHCFLVGLDAHMVLVMKTYGSPDVLKVDSKRGKTETAQSIGRFSIFIGPCRSLSVDATKFPGIEANCVYYTEHLGSSAHICKYNLTDKKAERISEAPEFVKQDKQFALVAARPFTTIHLLCNYTINVPDSQLALQQMS